MAEFVSIKVRGVDKAGAVISKVGKVGKDLTKEFQKIDKILRRSWMDNFAKQQGDGKRWAGLRPATMADRRRRGYPPASPILRRTGTLALGAMGRNQLRIKRISRKRAEFGVFHPGAVALQEGRANMRGREFITVDEKTGRAIIKVFRDKIEKAARSR